MSTSGAGDTRGVTAVDVAAALIARLGPMTAMKLQKLTYYVQASQLKRTGTVAFDDDFQAWRDGPVVRSLYDQHRGKYEVGAGDISGDAAAASQALGDVLDLVARRYGDLDAGELSDITHREEPWRLTRSGIPAHSNSELVIDRDLIKSFYTRQGSPERLDLVAANARLEGAPYGEREVEVLRRHRSSEIGRGEAVAELLAAR